MFYYLFYEKLIQYFSPFNVFKYITFRSIYAAVTALLICFILGPFVIKRLAILKFGQTIRWEVADTHNHKAGTPTMGGMLIIAAVLLSSALWARLDNPLVWVAFFATIWFGGVGFIDDYMKIIRSPIGMRAWHRIAIEAIGAFLIAFYMYRYGIPPTDGTTPITTLNFLFFKNLSPDLGWFFIPFAMIVIIGAANAVNLTDGLDGLATGCTTFVAVAYTAISYVTSHFEISRYLGIPHLPQTSELTVFCAALTGAGLGFLWYNCHPAQVFMGDTGALALGGVLGTIAVYTKNEMLLVILGGIFVFEVMSVIIQVISFKTRGKRVFKMSPIHHHFELSGWSEWRVVTTFWIAGLLLAGAGLLLYKVS